MERYTQGRHIFLLFTEKLLLFVFTAFRAVSWLGITLREVQEDKWQGAHREGEKCTAQVARDRCAEVQGARCEGARCEGARCKVDQRCKVQGARCEGARGRCKGQVHRGARCKLLRHTHSVQCAV